MPSLKSAGLALALALGAFIPASALAPPHEAQPVELRQSTGDARALADFISRALAPSRLPEIYADLRRAVGEVYLPALRDTLDGGTSDQPDFDEEDIVTFKAVADFLEYSLKASNELEPFLSDNRDAIILDFATLQAKYTSSAEIEALSELLELPAMRKIFNTLYAASRLVTGYSYDDMRSYYTQSAWLNDLSSSLADNPGLGPEKQPPSAEKIAKAGALITDLFRVSRLDEMVQDIVRFAKDVQSEANLALEDEDTDVKSQIEWLEFFYNLQKSIAMSAGPSMLATLFTDEQLNQLHLFILSPVTTKTFGFVHETVRSATSLTPQDIRALKRFSEKAEQEGLFLKRPPDEQAQLRQEIDALAAIWRDRAWEYLTPETREGLVQAIERLEQIRKDTEKGDKPYDDRLSPEERQL